MDIEILNDGSLLTLYENIREQVCADIRLGDRHRLVGDAARQRAEQLRKEIDRRGLQIEPIIWK
jgi:hypothetical protein